ncbi:flavin reductase family protein [Cellulophaga baltica]|uniref:flavin reductase family protein n=1 Tax=Cellulophaga TaxID=104264 RepID=UPI001C06ADA8|nr:MULTISPECIES: flavin reductase [Cellulophaga]MBU2997267.1 flavin reductase family protein [Cellulophaga baltica]MDO6768665.1 flavin reductase [Cellulophaga sp. 1_MG-2023]
MHYTSDDIAKLDRVTRLKIINAVTGIKPANLIGTINNKKQTNLAIFSSVVHLGSDPALLGFIARPKTTEVGHTLDNIKETSFYTINHIHQEFIENAHYTSAKLDRSISEFNCCKLTEEYIIGCKAPFVKESNFKLGMQFVEATPIKHNGTVLVIGEIKQIILPDNATKNTNDVDLEATGSIGISGLNSYYTLKKVSQLPYVRVNEIPDF